LLAYISHVPLPNRQQGIRLSSECSLAFAALFLSTVPLSAQTEVGLDLGVQSSYVWRGLTTTNKPVIQPAAYLSVPLGDVSVTVGAWSNIDLGKYDDLSDDISESGGSSSLNFAELEPYAEVSLPVGKTTLTGGLIGYVYPNSAAAPNPFGLKTSRTNTVEIYGKLGLDVPLSPELSIYYDVDKVNGAYLEGSISYSVPATDNLSVDLGAVAGFDAGQGQPDDPLSDQFNFADNGFTHLDLSAGVPLTAGPVSITPALHLVLNGDDATKVTSPADRGTDVKLWGGVSLSWSKAWGPQPEPDEGS
jgi:uncharacterized protein Gcw-chp